LTISGPDYNVVFNGDNMQKFVKYNSIENTYRTKEIMRIQTHGFDKGEWSVTEKVHGSNFSFLYDGNELKTAKRTGFCSDGFFNCHVIIEKYGLKIIDLYNDIGCKEIQVYGEIFGGNYPGLKSEYKSIQKGVFYTNDIEFYGFDIKADGEFLSVDKANELFKLYNIFYAEELFRGSFQECLDYQNEFNSTLPAKLGMEPLETNICEGVVIKPIEPKYFNGGSRVILKNKNDKFTERDTSKQREKKPVTVGPEALKLLDEMRSMINENRLRAVLSKGETIGQKDFGKLMGLVSQDILEELEKDYNLSDYDKSEIKILKKALGTEIATLIRPNFANIVDQMY
jgi:Rnl2 family RNA ligase